MNTPDDTLPPALEALPEDQEWPAGRPWLLPLIGGGPGWLPDLISSEGSGIDKLADALDSHRQWLLKQGQFTARRQRCQAEWLVKHLREEFGRYGMGLLGGEEVLFTELAEAPRRSPIAEYERLRERVIRAIKIQE